MNSMTGFAWQERTANDISVSVEIRGYNNRFLEVSLSLPSWLSCLEPKIRGLVSGCCGRGRVDVSIRVREPNVRVNVSVNAAAAKAYMEAVSKLGDILGIDEKISLSRLIEMEGVLETEKNLDVERSWNAVEPVLQEALATSWRNVQGKGSTPRMTYSLRWAASNLRCKPSPAMFQPWRPR